MANTVALAMGVAFTAISILGFVVPAVGGLHLSPAHTLLNLIMAILALFFGLIATDRGVRGFCITAGSLLAGLGVVGLLAGSMQATTLNGMQPIVDNAMWKIVPGQLEFGSRDHILHLITGAILLLAGFIRESRHEFRSEKEKENGEHRRARTNRQSLRQLPH